MILTFTKFRKQRYVYGTILNNIYKITGIVKFDLHAEAETGKSKLEVGGNVPGIFDLGPGRFGSETVFVPRQPGTECEEDDGYLILFVHDENTGYSSTTLLHCIYKIHNYYNLDLFSVRPKDLTLTVFKLNLLF